MTLVMTAVTESRCYFKTSGPAPPAWVPAEPQPQQQCLGAGSKPLADGEAQAQGEGELVESSQWFASDSTDGRRSIGELGHGQTEREPKAIWCSYLGQ